jgi:nucleotidyltransferase substrate binding protein (TIGR01987 family)
MTDMDIRWQQRFNNYTRALQQLSSAVSLAKTRFLSDLEKQGLIQAFKFTHALAWNVMRDYFQGNSTIMGSRDATRESFNKGLIEKGEVWMEMIKSRNQTSHTYNQAVADEIVNKTIELYHPSFQAFSKTIHALKNK